MKKPDGLSKLASLVGGGAGSSDPEPPLPSAGDDEKLVEDARLVLDLVQKLAGDNVFDMQTLVEFCADELRNQIRDVVEEAP